MAQNFQIVLHPKNESLHMKLNGDFDGSSAHILLNALKEHGSNFYQIHIDTNDLKTIYPFGRDVFQKNLKIYGKQINNLVFSGENKHNIAPY